MMYNGKASGYCYTKKCQFKFGDGLSNVDHLDI